MQRDGRGGVRFAALFALLFASAYLARAGVGTWTTNGPPGGDGTVVADPRTPGLVYGGSTTGIFKSLDGGATWNPTALTGLPASPVAVGASGTAYAFGFGPGNHFFVITVYKTIDGGAHWAALFDVGGSQGLPRFAVDPFSPDTLYLLTLQSIPLANANGGTLSRSVDGGATWTSITPSGFYVTAFGLDPGTPGSLATAAVNASILNPATDGAIFRSVDRGATWTRRGRGPMGLVTAVAIDPFASTTVYAVATSSFAFGGAAGAFRSDDGGTSFVQIYSGTPYAILLDPNRSQRVYLATASDGVQVSADRGSTWSALGTGLPSVPTVSLALDAVYLHSGTSGAVYDLQVGGLVLDASHPFSITLTATDQRTGRTGAGLPTQVNDLWGYFSIPAITGNANNPEVFVKMLDGTAINGAYWFFYGGLTDLEYTLTVTDVATGRQRTYTKPAGSECGGSDTAAFRP